MAARYVVTEKEGISDTTRVFRVTEPASDDWQRKHGVDVWLAQYASPRCTLCSTALRGMSSTCEHAVAVRRLIKREAPRP